jgi:hypothetical protein
MAIHVVITTIVPARWHSVGVLIATSWRRIIIYRTATRWATRRWTSIAVAIIIAIIRISISRRRAAAVVVFIVARGTTVIIIVITAARRTGVAAARRAAAIPISGTLSLLLCKISIG